MDKLYNSTLDQSPAVPSTALNRIHNSLDRALALSTRVRQLRNVVLGAVPETGMDSKTEGRSGTVGALLDHADLVDEAVDAASHAMMALERELANG